MATLWVDAGVLDGWFWLRGVLAIIALEVFLVPFAMMVTGSEEYISERRAAGKASLHLQNVAAYLATPKREILRALPREVEAKIAALQDDPNIQHISIATQILSDRQATKLEALGFRRGCHVPIAWRYATFCVDQNRFDREVPMDRTECDHG